MHRALVRAAVAAFFALAASAAFAQVKIGVTVSATGPAASLGIPERNTIPMCPKRAGGKTIDYIVTHIGASEVAAFFAEPIQGDGGIIIPAPGYFAAIAEFCADNGIVFVADEIQAGIARTGAWYSIEHHGVVPDLITSEKGIAGGFPLAAVKVSGYWLL